MVEFAPSILAADFSNLTDEINKVKKAKYIHLDIMDGRFVPNISFGPGIVKSIRPYLIVFLLIISAFLTPPDFISQIAMALPLYALFEGTLIYLKVTNNKSK